MTAHHHIGIQTADLDNCVAWYRDYFGARETWTLDTFSELTLSRLPGITRLTEVLAGGTRFHLFERSGQDQRLPGGNTVQFQHTCLAADSPEQLRRWRERWVELYESGNYSFARADQPTDIVIDADGVQSFYTYDVNGLEFEFTYVPDGP
ncbi:VOC family protein [Micromonospora sp. STR1_7]|uniref:VOC family protein n=1 Tax=Micromonospora parastrephiae TaxID=2806101 RepID=A0ABS1XNC0_9ACTN|nr:VOC family protein [Micromonospora parastrephiae]MBM0230760.1 VOC family protein [Micromonospora parastrephiae]